MHSPYFIWPFCCVTFPQLLHGACDLSDEWATVNTKNKPTRSDNRQLPDKITVLYIAGTAVAQSLRCYNTNWKVAGSISADVMGIFH